MDRFYPFKPSNAKDRLMVGIAADDTPILQSECASLRKSDRLESLAIGAIGGAIIALVLRSL